MDFLTAFSSIFIITSFVFTITTFGKNVLSNFLKNRLKEFGYAEEEIDKAWKENVKTSVCLPKNILIEDPSTRCYYDLTHYLYLHKFEEKSCCEKISCTTVR